MITNWDRLAAVEAFYVSYDLRQDSAEPVADGDDASAIKLRRLDVQDVIDARSADGTARVARYETMNTAPCVRSRGNNRFD